MSGPLTVPNPVIRPIAKEVDLRRDTAHDGPASESQANMHIQINEGIRSILIVEDEAIVSIMMEDLLTEMGVKHVHCCADVASALEIARTADIDCAVLDLWVRDGSSLAVADVLAERGIPFVFSTGTDLKALGDRYGDRPMLAKPFADDDFRLIVLDTWTLGGRRAEAVGGLSGRVATSLPSD